MQISLIDINKRKSPDSKGVVGLENGKFYCYNVDTDEAKYFPVGRGAINDYQWLDNDRCAAIAGGTRVILYDRKQNTLKEVVTLSVQCTKIGEPSPDGRFVFCLQHGQHGRAVTWSTCKRKLRRRSRAARELPG